jgi:ribosomal protein S18 acetylase RimI-like enzyme
VADGSIRRATAADLPLIEQLVTDAYGKYAERIGRKPAPMTADYASDLTAARVWVLCDASAVVGVLVTRAMEGYLLLDNVAVAPAAQGQGFGKMLLRRAEQDALELGLPQVRLYTNAAMTENLRFYPRHGFVETGRAMQDGFDRVFFAKDVHA